MAFCVCCYYNDGIIMAAQILSVVTFVIALIGYYIGGDIAAAIAMLLYLLGTCFAVKAYFFYAALIFTLLSVIGGILTLIFSQDFAEEGCENDDGSHDDGGFCEQSNVIIFACVGVVLQLTTAALTWHFLRHGRYDECQQEHQQRETSVHPVNEEEAAAAAAAGGGDAANPSIADAVAGVEKPHESTEKMEGR